MSKKHANLRLTETHVYFYGGPPSQWHTSNFIGHLPVVTNIEGQRIIRKSSRKLRFDNGEKYMMMGKASVFGDTEILQKMQEISDPRALKDWGQRVRQFDQGIWDAVNMIIVTLGNFYKFSQDDELYDFMKSTGSRCFVEGSRKDKIWGVGLYWNDPLIENADNWKGQNKLGQCLNIVRDMLELSGRNADAFEAYSRYLKTRKAA